MPGKPETKDIVKNIIAHSETSSFAMMGVSELDLYQHEAASKKGDILLFDQTQRLTWVELAVELNLRK